MPSWTKKDRRMYEHIKESEEDRGRGERRAREIAARTVNKQRREEERTSGSRTRHKAASMQHLEDLTKEELYSLARDNNIQGRSKMDKHGLVEAIRHTR